MTTLTVETPWDAIAARAMLYRALKALIVANGRGTQEPLRARSSRKELEREAIAAAETAMALYAGDEDTRWEIENLLNHSLERDGTSPGVRAAMAEFEPKPPAASVTRGLRSDRSAKRARGL
ncbi:hypothetical protein WDZ92_42895 [Nostoc sp. NIES-2111]